MHQAGNITQTKSTLGVHAFMRLGAALIVLLVALLAFSTFDITPAHAIDLKRQQITFSKIYNARDLGIYKTTDGRQIKRGMLIRSGELAYATTADLTKLKKTYNLGTVIDFRYKTDFKYCPDKKISGVKYVNIPAKYAKSPSKQTPKKRYAKLKKLSKGKLVAEVSKSARTVSRNYIYVLVNSSSSQKAYKKFFNQLLANKNGKAVLFHCTYGKDRTGVAAYMLLLALGVDEQTAYREFTLTNMYVRTVSPQIYKKLGPSVSGPDLLYAVNAAKKKHGSINKFFKVAYGLDSKKLKQLRSIYLEDQKTLRTR